MERKRWNQENSMSYENVIQGNTTTPRETAIQGNATTTIQRKTTISMNDEMKWRLSTGKVVEDALYQFSMQCTEEQ